MYSHAQKYFDSDTIFSILALSTTSVHSKWNSQDMLLPLVLSRASEINAQFDSDQVINLYRDIYSDIMIIICIVITFLNRHVKSTYNRVRRNDEMMRWSFGSWAVLSLLHTLLFPLFIQFSISFIHRMLFENSSFENSSSDSLKWLLANSNLAFMFLRLTDG